MSADTQVVWMYYCTTARRHFVPNAVQWTGRRPWAVCPYCDAAGRLRADAAAGTATGPQWHPGYHGYAEVAKGSDAR
jgi:hypothetical protein